MIRFIICENEEKFLSKIAEVVHKIMMPYDFEYKVNKFTGYNKDLENLITTKNEQKIYILDVEMPIVSGLEIASVVRENDTESTIIFITSYPEYKNDVFYSRLLALDYIQKGALWTNRLEDTLKYSIKITNRVKSLNFTNGGNSYRIPLKDINYVEKVQDKKKCIIYTEDGKQYPISENLNYMEKQLGPLFYKCHKSFLVNVENIKHINYSENMITFQSNHTEYLVSNRCKRGLRDYVEKY